MIYLLFIYLFYFCQRVLTSESVCIQKHFIKIILRVRIKLKRKISCKSKVIIRAKYFAFMKTSNTGKNIFKIDYVMRLNLFKKRNIVLRFEKTFLFAYNFNCLE